MSDQKMTLVERLRNPQYIGQGVGLPALFDTARTLADLKAAADRIEVLEALNRGLAKALTKPTVYRSRFVDDQFGGTRSRSS